MNRVVSFQQKLRRLRQQMLGWNGQFDILYVHVELTKKLYARNGLELVLTCSACPEQYEVFKDGKQIGLLKSH